jgi:hypothetical protein
MHASSSSRSVREGVGEVNVDAHVTMEIDHSDLGYLDYKYALGAVL